MSDSLDLFSFCFERYHQRVVGCTIGRPRFEPTNLPLPELLHVCSYFGWYARFLRHMLLQDARSREVALSRAVDALMDVWTARQTEKAAAWWPRIHEADVSTTPAQDRAAGSDGRSFYATATPQDLFMKLRAWSELAIEEHRLQGRTLCRVGSMLCAILNEYHRTPVLPSVQKKQRGAIAFKQLNLQCSFAPLNAAIAKQSSSRSSSGGTASSFDLASLSSNDLRKLSEALPVRQGCEAATKSGTLSAALSAAVAGAGGGAAVADPFSQRVLHIVPQLNNLGNDSASFGNKMSDLMHRGSA